MKVFGQFGLWRTRQLSGQDRVKWLIAPTIIALLGIAACTPSVACDQTCADMVNMAIVARAQLDQAANAGDRPSIEQVIREEWAGSGESEAWLFGIVWRESNFLPWARNRSGASGLFQLLGHGDLLQAACGSAESWADARCNARAARLLHDIAGRSPWRL